jgi:hypothetical protein
MRISLGYDIIMIRINDNATTCITYNDILKQVSITHSISILSVIIKITNYLIGTKTLLLLPITFYIN